MYGCRQAQSRADARGTDPLRTARRSAAHARIASPSPPSGRRTRRPGSPGRTTSPTGRASSGPIPWVYAEIVRVLAQHERVEILCHDETVRDAAREQLARTASTQNVRLHVVPTDRVWLRDSAPTGRARRRRRASTLGELGASTRGRSIRTSRATREVGARDRADHRPAAHRADAARRPASALVLEGGGIETDGEGTLLVTEEWLLSDVQVRNPGLDARRLRARLPRLPRHPRDDLARRGLRRRRHARPRRRHRALRRARRDRARVRGGSRRRREPPPLGRQHAAPRAGRRGAMARSRS